MQAQMMQTQQMMDVPFCLLTDVMSGSIKESCTVAPHCIDKDNVAIEDGIRWGILIDMGHDYRTFCILLL